MVKLNGSLRLGLAGLKMVVEIVGKLSFEIGRMMLFGVTGRTFMLELDEFVFSLGVTQPTKKTAINSARIMFFILISKVLIIFKLLH